MACTQRRWHKIDVRARSNEPLCHFVGPCLFAAFADQAGVRTVAFVQANVSLPAFGHERLTRRPCSNQQLRHTLKPSPARCHERRAPHSYTSKCHIRACIEQCADNVRVVVAGRNNECRRAVLVAAFTSAQYSSRMRALAT